MQNDRYASNGKSFFNGMGCACAAIISLVEFNHLVHQGTDVAADPVLTFTILAGLVIGTVSLGSMIAFGKLNGNLGDKHFHCNRLLTSVYW